MRNSVLHAALEAFTAEAALALEADTSAGAEIPFEIEGTRGGGGRAALYCYRPLTGRFIDDRRERLSALGSYAAAARALSGLEGLETYLEQRGTAIDAGGSPRAEAGLRAFLGRVFAERSDFTLDPGRFEQAYAELERAVYAGRTVTTVLAPLLGVGLDATTGELVLGEGLSLVRGDRCEHAPPEAVWGTPGLDRAREPNLLAVLTVHGDNEGPSAVSLARSRFRRILTVLRLFERGGYALGPLAWMRVDQGVWRPVAFGGSGRPGLLTLIGAAQEDELRAFWNLVSRRAPGGSTGSQRAVSPEGSWSAASAGGELAWALARYEMGCERLGPFEALTDYLLALRALLEPEGAHSGRLAGRLAVLCAVPEERAALAERTAHAISLERAVISGLAPARTGVDALVAELAEHLRALLRDVICGHLDPDLRALADGMLAEAAATVA